MNLNEGSRAIDDIFSPECRTGRVLVSIPNVNVGEKLGFNCGMAQNGGMKQQGMSHVYFGIILKMAHISRLVHCSIARLYMK